MKITQASAIATKFGEGKWMVAIALNDEEGGPECVRVNIVNEHPAEYKTESFAAKAALEVISGLGLENLVAERFPVMDMDHNVVEEEIPRELRDHLIKLRFDSGRFVIAIGREGRVRLSGAFIDTASDKGFLWTLSPDNTYMPKSLSEAAILGAALLKALGLEDRDHGHHMVHLPDRKTIVNDQGDEVQKQ
jgi:hypothetical protein